ncbi:MAG: hypothetical protein WBS20_17555, partial [Lysobacterales bacterium]
MTNRYERWIVALALVYLLAACGEENGGSMNLSEEFPSDNETRIAQDLIALAKKATSEARNQAQDEPSARDVLRFNQPVGVACLKANFIVESDLPPELRVGLFASPQTYPAWIRFANATDQPDTKKDFRGMSIKLMQVNGKKLLGSFETVDFLLNSHPVLFVGNPADFLDFVDHSVNSSPLWFFQNPFNLHFKEFRIVLAGRKHHASHLTIPYWSTTPYLFGEGNAVKYAVRPSDKNGDTRLPNKLTDGYLRDAVRKQMSAGGASFDFMVQFQT